MHPGGVRVWHEAERERDRWVVYTPDKGHVGFITQRHTFGAPYQAFGAPAGAPPRPLGAGLWFGALGLKQALDLVLDYAETAAPRGARGVFAGLGAHVADTRFVSFAVEFQGRTAHRETRNINGLDDQIVGVAAADVATGHPVGSLVTARSFPDGGRFLFRVMSGSRVLDMSNDRRYTIHGESS